MATRTPRPPARPVARRSAGPAPVQYTVRLVPLRHWIEVTLHIAAPAAGQRVSLPVWIPGSYLVREFARHLSRLTARQAGRAVACEPLDKCTWQIDCRAGTALELRYTVYAFDPSVRAAFLDGTRGFFNPTSVCLRVEGLDDAPHTIAVERPAELPHWKLATGLAPAAVDGKGFGRYQAAGYDELADSPFELGAFWEGQFKARGVPHRFVVAGAPAAFDGARLLRDAQRACEAAIDLWHPEGKPPFDRYLFMLNAVHDGYGGLEHRGSTALICNRADLPRAGQDRASEGYVTLLGLISHEYFHTWNVKRLRPIEFDRYDYRSENYTRLLWFFEGFTSYYDDLLLRRAGLIDDAGYLRLLTKAINQVLQAPGRQVQSVAAASFDAWIKYYRADENTPNATISYYTKGALVALCLDLTLRREGRSTLDDVMRALWRRCAGGPMAEDDVAAVLQELSGRSYARELRAWVHGTRDLPLKELLEAQGVQVREEPAQLAQRLGLRVAEDGGTVVVKVVLAGGAAEGAGLAAGDEWLGVEVPAQRGTPAAAWRLGKLDDLLLYAGAARRVTALVARDRQLLRLPLTLPAQQTTWRLASTPKAPAAHWPGR